MYGEHFAGNHIVYQAVMENDGEYTIYKSKIEFGEPQIILDQWVVPEGVALALANLFENEQNRNRQEQPA